MKKNENTPFHVSKYILNPICRQNSGVNQNRFYLLLNTYPIKCPEAMTIEQNIYPRWGGFCWTTRGSLCLSIAVGVSVGAAVMWPGKVQICPLAYCLHTEGILIF